MAMTSVFDFLDYRVFLKAWIDSHGNKSHGLKTRMAQACEVSSTLMSLVLKGEKSLSLEQALSLSEFLTMNELETDYFLGLVELDRAGTPKLRSRVSRKLKALSAQSKQVSSRMKKDLELSEENKAVYYSNWVYVAIRNLTAVEGFQTASAIAQRLHLPQKLVLESLDFLIRNQLCRLTEKGYTYGPALTLVPKESPFVNQHHHNWRQKSLETMSFRREEDLFVTAPVSLSAEDSVKVKALLLTAFESAMKIVKPSPSEKVFCLNLDWFEW